MKKHVRLLAALAVAIGVFALGAGSASAALTFPFDGQLAPESGSFGTLEPGSVAVDDANGDTYVADSATGVVDVFETTSGTQVGSLDSTLTPAGSFGGGLLAVAANNATGDVYVLDPTNNVVDVFSAGSYVCQITGAATPSASECNGPTGSDTPAHGFNAPGGIAVDQATGEVYVVDASNGAIDVFSAAGAYERQILLSSIPGGYSSTYTREIAVDDFNGHVYVADSGSVVVYEFNAAGEYLTTWTGANTPAGSFGGGFVNVAADDASGRVYVTETGHGVTNVFEASGEYVTQFGHSYRSPQSTALDQATHRVYISDREAGVVYILGPGPLVIPDVTTGGASGLRPTAATLNGTVNPDGLQVTACSFEYGTTAGYGQSVACTQEPGSGTGEVQVSAEVSGLQPNTTYHYRLTAANANGPNAGEDAMFTTPGPPVIDSDGAAGVTQRSAVLQAQINPKGEDTTYRFEYGTSAAYGSRAPNSDADIGSGANDVSEEIQIQGLAPSTTYHYRVVAINAQGAVQGPDHTFTTQGAEAPGLLDGRAWEMVSPPDKHGAALEAIDASPSGTIEAAQAGGAITYLASNPTEANPAGNRSIVFTQVLSTRGPGGWVSRDINPRHEPPTFGIAGGISGEFKLFTDDLSVGLLEPGDETPLSPQATERTLYLRAGNGELTPLVTAGNVLPGAKFGIGENNADAIVFSGASSDLEHVVFRSPHVLTPGFASGFTENERPNLYEWASNGSLQLVSVLPDERPAAEEELNAALSPEGFNEGARNAVSEDGSRVFWLASNGHLYLRDTSLGQTLQLDVPQEGALGGSGEARFQMANSDGSKVFFTDESQLTPDATSGPQRADLYMCEIGVAAGKPTCKLKDLTVTANPGEGADVQGVVMGSDESDRYLYVVANGILAPGAVQGNCNQGSASNLVPNVVCNMYVIDTATGQTRLVAVLPGSDYHDWTASGGNTGDFTVLTSRVSPNGRYLAFMSQKSLTGYDNVDARSGKPDAEVFLYDRDTGRIVCGSCNPSGARPIGLLDPTTEGGRTPLLVDTISVLSGQWLAASIPGWTGFPTRQAMYQSRYLSNSGRLFFDAQDALVPWDVNGHEDVYEYEPDGVGECSQTGGCVGLVSSGSSSEESAFMDASESGDEVFFLTASRLVPQDVDGALDVYDARVCTSDSPCVSSPTAPAVPCSSSESCRGAGLGQEAATAPASVSASGDGNLAPPGGGTVAHVRRLTRAQKLAAALRACHKKTARRRRLACETRARKLYGTGVRAKRARHAGATRKGNG